MLQYVHNSWPMLHIFSIAIFSLKYYYISYRIKPNGGCCMREKLMRFLMGRNGMDHFSRFLSIASLVVLILSMFIRGYVGSALWGIALALLIYSYFRIFSKNIPKRYAENTKYLQIKYKVTGWFNRQKELIRQSKTHRFYRCPQCHITTRIPKGKGKIRITCPKCGHVFIRKS